MSKTNGHGGVRKNAGRKAKPDKGIKFQIIAYPKTITAIKQLKARCTASKADFVDALNAAIMNGLTPSVEVQNKEENDN